MELEFDNLNAVAWVQTGKTYVAYHLMGVYGNPKLLQACSPALKARMQGKSCFNFTKIDEPLFRELADLTARSLAGMKSAFSKGQGRHLQSERRSLGDLYAQVLRMVGGTDMTFGSTGTLGDLLKKQSMSGAAATDTAIDKAYVGSALKLHLGALDL